MKRERNTEGVLSDENVILVSDVEISKKIQKEKYNINEKRLTFNDNFREVQKYLKTVLSSMFTIYHTLYKKQIL